MAAVWRATTATAISCGRLESSMVARGSWLRGRTIPRDPALGCPIAVVADRRLVTKTVRQGSAAVA